MGTAFGDALGLPYAMGAAAALTYQYEKSASIIAFPGADKSYSSGSYVNLTTTSGGANVAVTITKSAGTSVWISASCNFTCNPSVSMILGVNDGTTDYDVSKILVNNNIDKRTSGNILITGLGAGTFTFTGRVKVVTSTTGVFSGTTGSCYLRATEVSTSNVKVTNKLNNTGLSGFVNTANNTIQDVLDGVAGADYSVALTKSAGTDIIGLISTSGTNPSTGDTRTIYLGDGTNDTVAGKFSTAASPTTWWEGYGIAKTTGLGAGARTYKFRGASTTASGSNWNAGANSTINSIAVLEAGLGGINANASSVVFASTFSTTSASYVNILDATAGSPITVTINKQQGATTNLVVMAAMVAVNSTGTMTLGVRDGTTDFDMARCDGFIATNRHMLGERAFAGLLAGSYTYTLRGKTSGGTMQGGGGQSAQLFVMEVAV